MESSLNLISKTPRVREDDETQGHHQMTAGSQHRASSGGPRQQWPPSIREGSREGISPSMYTSLSRPELGAILVVTQQR